MENGRRDQGQGPESDEDDDHQQNTPDTGRKRSWPVKLTIIQKIRCGMDIIVWFSAPGWTANFRDCRENAGSQTLAGWVAAENDARTQDTGWANFTQFEPFSG